MTLDQMIIRASETASRMFANFGHVPATWIAERADGTPLPIVLDMPDEPAGRAAVANGLRDVLMAFGAVRMVSIVEAWTVEGAAAQGPHPATLATHPDRREVIFIQAEDIEGNTRAARFYILRPEHGKPTLSELKDYPQFSAAGRMSGLLQPAPDQSTRH